jgi:two-component system LytT family response regulator
MSTIRKIDTSVSRNLITKKDHDQAVELLGAIKDLQNHCALLEALLINQELQKKSTQFEKIPLAVRDGYIFQPVKDIVRCQADGNYTFIYTKEGTRFLQAQTLKDIERYLPEEEFIRVHQSHLINISCINRYKRNGGHTLVMSDKSEIPISRKRRTQLLRKMNLIV